MDKLENRRVSRAAREDNNGEQVPTQTTKPKRGEDDTTVYATAATFHEQLRNSAELDVTVATEAADKEIAQSLLKAIRAPAKQQRQQETASLDATTAANSANAAGTAQSQANQTGTGADMKPGGNNDATSNATGREGLGNGGGASGSEQAGGWTGAAKTGKATK